MDAEIARTKINCSNSGLEGLDNAPEELNLSLSIKKIITVCYIFLIIFFSVQIIRSINEVLERTRVNFLVIMASSMIPTNNIKALRTAEAAYKMKSANTGPSVIRALSAAAYSTTERPFYKFKSTH